MDTAELFIDSLERIKMTGLEISFIILNNLNTLNYQLTCKEEIKRYLKTVYQSTLRKLVDNKSITIEEILFFYQSALTPNNSASVKEVNNKYQRSDQETKRARRGSRNLRSSSSVGRF